MSKPARAPAIRLRGVRHNNLKNFDLDLPLGRLIVLTGLSGSGKSSLAFDTLFAEGQRRYIETFSPYARQFFDRMDKPQVDSIEGIPPAIAIEQRNAVRTTRSTVGTMTEICDYMKVLWLHEAQLHCRGCGQPVRKDTPQQIWETLNAECGVRNAELLITFTLPLAEKLSLSESLALIARQGYQRLLVEADAPRASLVLRDAMPGAEHGRLGSVAARREIVRLDEAASHSAFRAPHSALTVVQDRLSLAPASRARFIEACEQAYHFGKGRLAVHFLHAASPDSTLNTRNSKLFSNHRHCAACDLEYREPSPALFSFNHPLGACPACRGFGRIISIDYDLAIPDRSKSLAGGCVKPWRVGHGLESQQDLMVFCRKRKVPTGVPFEKLPGKIQNWVIDGDPDYGQDEQHRWPRAWYGVKGYFRWLESKAYKMHVRVLLSRYRTYSPCPDCQGKRFQPEALLYKVRNGECGMRNEAVTPRNGPDSALRTPHSTFNLADFYALPIRDALRLIEQLLSQRPASRHSTLRAPHSALTADPLGVVLEEVRSRLGYLVEVGLGYLTLDRPTRTLSGGETERVNLTTCLGTRLVNTLFVLDEPSVGLHPRDTDRLVRILQRLRDAGNTVVVVEHEASVMRAADQLVDLGPGHGEAGGQVVFQGTFAEILKAKDSVTGRYLGGSKRIEIPVRRPVHLAHSSSAPAKRAAWPVGALTLAHANLHNLKDLSVQIPLSRFVCVTGVSGSGKTTLVRDVLLPLLSSRLSARASKPAATPGPDADPGTDKPAARHPQSTIRGWESLGQVVLVDQSLLGKTPRSNPAVYLGAFDDIRELFARSGLAQQRGLKASAFSFNSTQGQCERCRGAGFEKIEMQFLSDVFIRCPDCNGRRYREHVLEIKLAAGTPAKSIADLLETTVDEAILFLAAFPESRPARRAAESLRLLQQVGLGYLRLGQPINTLSGGESQRLKLVSHLAKFGVPASTGANAGPPEGGTPNPALFLFDEPTTGLHFDDVRVLLKVFQRLVDAGHSVLIVEHNLDVIKSADWVIDLGPDAGDEGGRLVAQGTPEQIAGDATSHTGRALREMNHRSVRGGYFPGSSSVISRPVQALNIP